MTATTATHAEIYPLTIYYDSRCPMCKAEKENLMLHNDAGNLVFADIWADGFEPPPGRTVDDLLERIHGMQANGQLIDSMELLRRSYEGVNMGWVTALTTWPVLGGMADWAYPILARNRHRIPRWIGEATFQYMMRRSLKKRCGKDGVCAVETASSSTTASK